MKLQFIQYCTSHYKHEYCLEKARELRKTGKYIYKAVKVGYTIIEDGQKYSRIYVAKKENSQ